MRIFVSYARQNRQSVDTLIGDIRRGNHDVWVDQQLTGGQSWWDTILTRIREADLFVIALSPDLLKSRACISEINYAQACNRSILPVMVAPVSPQMAPPVIANSQIVDYVDQTKDAAIQLMTALAAAPVPGPLPSPLPPSPPVPMSYLNTYRERLDELSLTWQQQSHLLSELRAHLNDADDREAALSLIRRLRSRPDIAESVGKEIDELLGSVGRSATWGAPHSEDSGAGAVSAVASSAATADVGAGPASSTQPDAGWHADPFGRYEQRYWDGTAWTEHVTKQNQRAIDPPVAAAQTTPAAFSAGTFAALVVASLFCFGMVGVVAGAMNLKTPARRSQAIALLVIGLISMLLGFIAAAEFAGSSASATSGVSAAAMTVPWRRLDRGDPVQR